MSTTNVEVFNVELHMINVYSVDVEARSRAEAKELALLYYDAHELPPNVFGSQVDWEECDYCEIDGVEYGLDEEDE